MTLNRSKPYRVGCKVMNKNILVYSVVITGLIFMSGCTHNSNHKLLRRKLIISHHHQQAPFTTNAVTITVWIHGTKLLPGPFAAEHYFTRPGLHHLNTLPAHYHLHELAQAMAHSGKQNITLEHFYAFGWSGKLDAKIRQQAATQLYNQLAALVAQYKSTYNSTPGIQLVTHSHGGNIALNMAPANATCGQPLSIDKLIMLACPVQTSTKKYMSDRLFKKMYALYSSIDMMQVLAPQICYTVNLQNNKKRKQAIKMPMFSSRRFSPQTNLAQVKIKLNGRAVLHTEFATPHFIRLLPQIIDAIDHWPADQTSIQYAGNNDEQRLLSVHA